ncbi:type II toxin-antitoxin system RelE/ParE family toxin [Methylobacterium sp. SD274]|uniref:type II toxin-antitoxin system RelE/ParE family toxin n=1 Tax=Methylobacterium sp. SD274 TaxID=2782009 RepID=UPI001A97986A|nr:type II toxin-antitoxin system RelE/ParE family toxin [Methylobacterium sp. SD274]MBO1022281.1 type II toxin-antitoxin system RelE/ParE family toxin [Methylobacterium sp. SD274]
MIVVCAETAEADLERIGDYISSDNPARAAAFVQALIACCERLADANGLPLVRRYECRGIRVRTYGNYLMFYRVGAATIDIVHILHGAQDYGPILFPSP